MIIPTKIDAFIHRRAIQSCSSWFKRVQCVILFKFVCRIMSQQEKEYLELFKKQRETMLGWGNSEFWSNSDFEKLSELIFAKTNVSLSISTLKRVWGKVRYDSIPTTTTLNTLAQFSGYESWRSFCAKAAAGEINNTVASKAPLVQDNPAKPFRNRRWISAALLLTTLIAIVLVWTSFHNKTAQVIDRSKIVFTSKMVSDDLPNSVVFDYDIGNVHVDSMVLQQSWDTRRRETLSPQQHQHTSIYYYPGFFKAKLIVNNQLVKEHEVYIKTKGWQGVVQPDQAPDTKPFYLSDKEIRGENGAIGVTSKILTEKTGKKVFNDVWTGFFDAHEFNVDPNDFTFNATLRNTSAKEEVLCQHLKVNIIASSGFISVPLCTKGCISDIRVNVSDRAIDGRDHDLSALGCDFLKPVNLKLVVKNKVASVFLDQKLALTVPYSRNLGRIVNLIVLFEGSGFVKNIAIR